VNGGVKFRVTDLVDRPGETSDWYRVSYRDAAGKQITGYVHTSLVGTYWAD
jgi:hypothetical protein